MCPFSAVVSAFSSCLSTEPLSSFFLADLLLLYLYSYIPFFFVYFSGLNVLSRFNLSCLFSVITSHVALLIHSSFLVLIKNNLCCIIMKFTNVFPFFLYNVKYSFCIAESLFECYNWKSFLIYSSFIYRAINLSCSIFLIYFLFSWWLCIIEVHMSPMSLNFITYRKELPDF